jgi:hypothetical protein
MFFWRKTAELTLKRLRIPLCRVMNVGLYGELLELELFEPAKKFRTVTFYNKKLKKRMITCEI